MFKYAQNSLIVPQFEHLRLAGTLALLWGNDHFDKPALDTHTFVEGVAFHDLGFGLLDTFALNEMSPTDRHTTFRQLLSQDLGDPSKNLIALHHILRLIGNNPEFDEHRNTCLTYIHKLIAQYHLDIQVFEWTDRITDLCDSISYDFCFGQPTDGEVDIYSKIDSTELTHVNYTISAENVVTITPWPLSVPEYKDYIVGYETEGYPDTLRPHSIQYNLRS